MPSTLGIVASHVVPFSPLDLSPSLWFDAADTATITSSGSPAKVSQWDDKSGNGRHATQATASAQPTTAATTKNGRNVIDFNGTSAFLGPTSTGFNITTNGVTWFIVHSTVDVSGKTTNALSQQDLGGTGRGWLGKPAGSEHQTFLGGGLTLGVGAASQGWFMHHLYCATGSNQTLTLVQNASTTSTATRTLESTTGGIVIGVGKGASVATNWWQGSIAEIVIFGYVLSASERSSMQSYLNSKWAVY